MSRSAPAGSAAASLPALRFRLQVALCLTSTINRAAIAPPRPILDCSGALAPFSAARVLCFPAHVLASASEAAAARQRQGTRGEKVLDRWHLPLGRRPAASRRGSCCTSAGEGGGGGGPVWQHSPIADKLVACCFKHLPMN